MIESRSEDAITLRTDGGSLIRTFELTPHAGHPLSVEPIRSRARCDERSYPGFCRRRAPLRIGEHPRCSEHAEVTLSSELRIAIEHAERSGGGSA